MRDILITIIILGSLPFILKSPAIGGLMWVWVSVMNPHTQGWGFATQLPFAMIIAVATMASMLLSRTPQPAMEIGTVEIRIANSAMKTAAAVRLNSR